MRRNLTLLLVVTLLGSTVVFADSAAELGRVLFFDARLSGDATRSCADCHDPEQGFSKQFDANGDIQRLSDGYTGSGYFRNAPTLINVTRKQDDETASWGWDGRMRGSLAEAVGFHIESPRIMHIDPLLLRERMKQDQRYVELCRTIYDDECGHDLTLKALAAFLATLVSYDAPIDRGELSRSAERGRVLFNGKAGCADCHSGPLFTDLKPHATGAPEERAAFTDPLRHLSYRSMLAEAGVDNADEWRRDVGYFVVSGDTADVGSFVTPTLRELRYTAPYMHSGAFDTLQQVVDYYDAGPATLKPLQLSRREKGDLVAFLDSLSSDEPFAVQVEVVSPNYSPTEDWLEQPN